MIEGPNAGLPVPSDAEARAEQRRIDRGVPESLHWELHGDKGVVVATIVPQRQLDDILPPEPYTLTFPLFHAIRHAGTILVGEAIDELRAQAAQGAAEAQQALLCLIDRTPLPEHLKAHPGIRRLLAKHETGQMLLRDSFTREQAAKATRAEGG